MNAHQRRIQRRQAERAPMDGVPDDDEGYCQDCGDFISFADGSAYVTSSGDVYCWHCGIQADDEEQEMMDGEDGWDFYSTGEDIIEQETYGVYIGPDNVTMGGAE